MMPAMRKVLFDASAILKWLQMEAGGGKVKRLIRKAERGKMAACMSQVNLAEVYYKTISLSLSRGGACPLPPL